MHPGPEVSRLPHLRGRPRVLAGRRRPTAVSRINHWRPLWHQERAAGAQLAERESLRRTGTHAPTVLNSSPGFKRWCYELTRRKDSAEMKRGSQLLGCFQLLSNLFSPLGLVSSASHRDAGFLYGENALQKRHKGRKPRLQPVVFYPPVLLQSRIFYCFSSNQLSGRCQPRSGLWE